MVGTLILDGRPTKLGGYMNNEQLARIIRNASTNEQAEEISLVRTKKLQVLKLGPRVLRAETASLAAVAVLQMHFGDLS